MHGFDLERKPLKPSALKILHHFQLHGVADAVTLSKIALDYRKRISELRRAGYEFTSARVPGQNFHVYRMEGRA